MSNDYLIPHFIIKYLQKSRSIKNPQKLIGERLKKFKTPEIEKWFKDNKVNPTYIWKFFVIYGLDRFSFRECPICGKRLTISQLIAEYKYCSAKCSNSSDETKEKSRQTCLKKYGVESPLQSKEIQEKVKQTCLEKYGVHHFSKTEIFKEKFKETSIEKYGVENPFQSEVCKKKSKETCLEKYGVEYSLQSKEIQEKHKQTCLENYGVEHPAQSKEILEKIRHTNLEKYGAESPLESEKIQEKIRQTNIEKYGVENPNQSKEIRNKIKQTHRSNYWKTFCSNLKEKNIIPLFSKEEYINDTGRKFKCLCCNKVFKSEGTCDCLKKRKSVIETYTTLETQHIYCPHCSSKFSKKEKDVASFIKSIYGGTVEENIKGLFSSNPRMELDVYLPSLNLGLEFDGNYWHSKEGAKERDENKNQLCEERGIHLLRIKESDWDSNPEKVKEEIKYFLQEKEIK